MVLLGGGVGEHGGMAGLSYCGCQVAKPSELPEQREMSGVGSSGVTLMQERKARDAIVGSKVLISVSSKPPHLARIPPQACPFPS